jgi:PAT family acetyl-CoA transporter-like MFS transporter 1
LEKQDYGIITLQGFMFSIGVFFFVSTILLMIFKKEVDSDEMKLSMCSTYKTIKSILWIPSMRRLVFLLLTIKIGFAMDSLMILKLIDLGVSKEKLVFLFILLTPVSFIQN